MRCDVTCEDDVVVMVDRAFDDWGIRMAAEQGIGFDEWKARALGRMPLRTISQPENIGNLALFLASDESRTITGQSINCDAGSIMIG